jgi:tetratricopeptide (TPR) repeat protein
MKRFYIAIFFFLVTSGLFAQKSNLIDFFLFFMNNEYDSARVFLERQTDQNPESKQLQYYLGKTHLALNNYSPAVTAFRKALEGKKSDTRIYQYLGQVYEEQGMLPEAIEAYETIGQFRPLRPAIQLKLAYLYFKQGSYNPSIKTLNDFMKQDSTHLYAHYLLGRSYLKKDVYDSAIVVADRAIQLDSTSFPNYLNLGIAYFDSGKSDIAKGLLERAVELSPRSDEARYYLAEAYAKQKQVDRAIEQHELSTQLNGPFAKRSLKNLVSYYYKAENRNDCIAAAIKYLALKPDDAYVHHFYARALSDSLQFHKAEDEFIQAILWSNKDFIKMTYFYRALNFYHKKDYPNAIAYYKKVIAIDPEFSFAYYNLAITYDDYYQEKKTAINYYEKFISMEQGNNENHLIVEAAKNRLAVLKEKRFFKRDRK